MDELLLFLVRLWNRRIGKVCFTISAPICEIGGRFTYNNCVTPSDTDN